MRLIRPSRRDWVCGWVEKSRNLRLDIRAINWEIGHWKIIKCSKKGRKIAILRTRFLLPTGTSRWKKQLHSLQGQSTVRPTFYNGLRKRTDGLQDCRHNLQFHRKIISTCQNTWVQTEWIAQIWSNRHVIYGTSPRNVCQRHSSFCKSPSLPRG